MQQQQKEQYHQLSLWHHPLSYTHAKNNSTVGDNIRSSSISLEEE
jgi:hypothetical protein